MSALPLPPSLRAYRIATAALAPLAPSLVAWRARRGKEDAARAGERFGRASLPRPAGPVVWVHGASVGETLSLFGIVEALAARGFAVLLTSGTRTAAALLARRLPAGARHQYVPLDVPRFVRSFLDHWRPGLAIFAESELWPNAVVELERRGVPLALVNARMSERSAGRWGRAAPGAAASLLGRVALCLAQTDGDAARLAGLGARTVSVAGNLKFDLAPPPADPVAVETLASRLAGRPVWLAASTHPGEEAAALAAHAALSSSHPGLLTILAPRHPERGEAVAAEAEAMGLGTTRHGAGGHPADAADVHVVDAVGELGLFYRVAPVAFVGGSLVPHGGQNPIEPARLGAAILHGPHVANFADIYAALAAARACVAVPGPGGLADALGDLLGDTARQRQMARRAGVAVAGLEGALVRTVAALEPLLAEARASAPP